MTTQVLLLIIALLGAVIADFVMLPVLAQNSPWRPFVEHLSIALFVAAALGLTYEFARERHLRELARQAIAGLQGEVHKALEALGRLSPRQVFDLLMDIASCPDRIPTLFNPPRSEAEYNFVQDRKYFDDFVPTARQHVIDALQLWLAPGSARNVKFLGSDFVGRYELHELRDYLFQQANPRIEKWNSILAPEKEWVLNYIWAASRCEKPRYAMLHRLLLNTPYEDIQEWILFVPRQMDQQDFLEIVNSYLGRFPHISRKCVKCAIWALAAIQESGVDTAQVFINRRTAFELDDAKKEIEAAWQEKLLDPGMILNALQRAPRAGAG